MSKLFAIEPGEEAAGAEVQKNFKTFLQNFIRRNALKLPLLSNMNVIMVNCESLFYLGLCMCIIPHTRNTGELMCAGCDAHTATQTPCSCLELVADSAVVSAYDHFPALLAA